jgi:GNAT superfamily N-acetyltransferase
MHPLYADPEQRAQLWALLEATWPGLPARFDRAAGYGWPVGAVSRPFVARHEGRIVSHVGVLELPVRLAGEDRRVAGIHGVCTHPDQRRQGHYRAAMQRAMAWIAPRFPAAKLNTDQPWVYEPFGFRVVPQHRFHLPAAGPGGGTARPVTETDLPWLRALLVDRSPVSDRFAAREPGWLVGIDAVLWAGGLGLFQRVEALDLAVSWKLDGGALQLFQVFARELPSLDSLLAHCPWAFDELVLWFGPDRLAPGAQPRREPGDEVLMIWGDWPEQAPFRVSPLEEH